MKTPVRVKVQKTKKDDKLSTKLDKKSSSKEKKRKANDSVDDQPKKKRKEKETVPAAPPKSTTSSNDGLTKTQKRNRRKAFKRIKEREEREQLQQQQQAQHNMMETKSDDVDNTASSEHLLKYNKNKRKDFLKVQSKKKREHVRFDGIDEEEAPEEMTTTYDQYDAYEYGYEEDQGNDQQNLYGAAYVTSIEADQRYKGEKKDHKAYPIDHMADHFYAEAPPADEQEEEEDIEMIQETHQREQQPPIQRNYEELPKLGFTGPSIPAVGDLIAFKVLGMTQ